MHIIVESLTLSSSLGLTSAIPIIGYIDPATGGMLFQILAGMFALCSGLVLVFRRRIQIVLARVMRSLRKTDVPGQER
jgi:hypothetical protein